MKRTRWAGTRVRLLLRVVVLAALAGCGSGSDDSLSGAGESCTKTADCRGDLKCVNLVCQQAGADCPGDKNCSGRECGMDPVCGVSCGSCSQDKTCQNGQCVDLGSEDTHSPPTTGTWNDPTSGLMWQNPPYDKTRTWSVAKSYCDSLSLGGHSDWHLPSIGEFRSLLRGCPATQGGGSCNIEEGDCLTWLCRDDSCAGCSGLDGPGEGGMYWPDEVEGDCCWYWSSSPVQGHDGYAWYVDFGQGRIDYSYVYFDFGTHVRCVR